MHISRMTGESSPWHRRFFSMSTIASSTYDSGLFYSNRKMSSDLKHSMTAAGYFCSTFFSSK
jgi:hypothetical protein